MSSLKDKTTDMLTVRNLLSDNNYFRIPDYQRGYAWSTQFHDLWKDILRVYKNKRQHYTGMLALEEMNDEEKKQEFLSGKDAFYVVDGQQRLTSIIIIIQELIRYIKKDTGKDVESDIQNILLSTNSEDYGEKQKRFNYCHSRDVELKYFDERIYKGETYNQCADIYLKNINDAKEYIDLCLKKFGSDEAKIILDSILDDLVFNIYYIKNSKNRDDENCGFDVRVTFETMNNRGKKLSNLELLKNRLMYLSTFIREKEDELKTKINNAWKEIYKNICYKNYQLDDDEYLQAHWIIYGSLDKSKGDSYIKEILNVKFSVDEGDFSDFIGNGDNNAAFEYIVKYVDSLERYSKYWGIINNPNEKESFFNDKEKEEIKYLDSLNKIASMKFVKSTVMVVAAKKQLNSEDKKAFYKKLERSIFINKLLYRSKNDYSALIKDARNLSKSEDGQVKEYYNNLLKTLDSHNEFQCNKERVETAIVEFVRYLNKKNNYFYDWDGINYFLYEYEKVCSLENNEIVSINNVSVEHILPQNPSIEYWEIVLEPIKDEKEINRITNSLGNLLLLPKNDNSSLQNKSFFDKKETTFESKKYSYKYGLRSAKQIANEDYWTPYEIAKRQNYLFKFMYERWIKNSVPMSKDDFMKLVKNNGLLIEGYNELNPEVKEKLDKLKSNESKSNNKHKEKESNSFNFKELTNYFDKDKYDLNQNRSNAVFNENKFTFTIKGDRLTCKFKKDDDYYKYEYNDTKRTMKIKHQDEKGEWLNQTDENSWNEATKYFVKTFKRYLKHEKEQEFEIVEDDKSKNEGKRKNQQHLNEEEFFSQNSKRLKLKYLYDAIIEKFNISEDVELRCTPRYIALKKKHIFAEFLFYTEKNKIGILLYDVGKKSTLGGVLPQTYKWSHNYRIFVKELSEVEEAVELINESYKIASK